MNPHHQRSAPGAAEPPRRGLSLGWRIALSTSLVVTVVMGTTTFFEHAYEIRAQRRAQELLLEHALVPLAAEIGQARGLDDVRTAVLSFHEAYLRKGGADHQLVLRDSEGTVLVSTSPVDGAESDRVFEVSVPVASSLFQGQVGAVSILEDATEFEAAVRRQWRSWGLHMGVTIGSTLLFLLLAIRVLVVRPLLHLLEGVRKMELGYWGELPIPAGAWEIRWLCWRFREMGLELERNVQLLVAAERRASEAMVSPGGGGEHSSAGGDAAIPVSGGAAPAPAFTRLRDRLLALESMAPGDRSGTILAREVWDRDAMEAEQLGDPELKARLEDVALRILEPDAYHGLERVLAGLRRPLDDQIREWEAMLRGALDEQAVSCSSVRHRVKHTAGVWSKMRSRGLELGQVHDLIAFRIVVPTEQECYQALGAVHGAFEPVVGRFKDYIAEPKTNGYRALHTRVRSIGGTVFEVQIRSAAMDEQAERGRAAHWSYKLVQPAQASIPHPGRGRRGHVWGYWRGWSLSAGAGALRRVGEATLRRFPRL